MALSIISIFLESIKEYVFLKEILVFRNTFLKHQCPPPSTNVWINNYFVYNSFNHIASSVTSLFLEFVKGDMFLKEIGCLETPF